MIDPMVSLAFALHSNRGAYAALVGSGVSVGAGFPTGWQVVLDLISKVARVLGKDPEKSETQPACAAHQFCRAGG